MNLQKKIPCGSTSVTWISFASQTDTLAVVNSGRNVNFQSLFATAVCTRKINQLVATKCCLVEADGNFCVQVLAFLLVTATKAAIAAVSKAISITGTIKTSTAETTIKSASKRAVFKTRVTKTASSKSVCGTSLSRIASSSEASSKQILQNIVHVTTFEMKFLIAAIWTSVSTAMTISKTAKATESRAVKAAVSIKATFTISGTASTFFKCCMTELIIEFFLLRVTEHIICFCDFLKLFFSIRISRV